MLDTLLKFIVEHTLLAGVFLIGLMFLIDEIFSGIAMVVASWSKGR